MTFRPIHRLRARLLARRQRLDAMTPAQRIDRRQRRTIAVFTGFLLFNAAFDVYDEIRDESARDDVKGIILTVDCNTRHAFQEALDALDDAVLEEGAVVVTRNCPEGDT